MRLFTGDNGTLSFWDYNTGTAFQNLDDIPQPGSLEAEAGVFCSTFDVTGTRLITGGADKTIKVCTPIVCQNAILLTRNQDLCGAIPVIDLGLSYVPYHCMLSCNVALSISVCRPSRILRFRTGARCAARYGLVAGSSNVS